MNHFIRQAYILVMIIAFFAAILMSFLQMLKEQTTFEEKTIKNHGTFPSLTICESQDNINLDTKYKTFEDVMTAIEESKLNVFASILYRHNTFDLKNYSSLRGKFETTYEKVWSHPATIFQDEYATIIICTTLNLDFITKPDHLGSVWLNLTILTERPIYVEKHMPWQSLHNYQFNWVDGFDILYTNKDRKTTGLLTTGLLTTGHVTTGLLDNWSFGQLVLLTTGLLDNWSFRQLVFWTTGLLPNWSRRPVPKRPVV